MTTAAIHYHRPGKPLTIYNEDFVSDDGLCLRTFKTLPPEIGERLSQSLQKDGLISPQRRVLTVAKAYFYNENFNLLEFRDTDGELLGHYSDIGAPLTKIDGGLSRDPGGDYAMTDWFLDLWLTPAGEIRELDWDEFDQALAAGLLTETEAAQARATLARLKAEIGAGIYPYRYIVSVKE
jgi:predicted RNA-binding protein associated with RNAse of E/G family